MTIWLMMLQCSTMFGIKIICGSEDIIQTNIHSVTFSSFTVTLTMNTVTQFLHRTHLLIILHYQTKFGCKQTSSLENIVEIYYISTCCDLDIEDNEPIFVHNTLPPNNASQYQGRLKMVEQFRRYCPGKLRQTDR